jgi:hypothetical protein
MGGRKSGRGPDRVGAGKPHPYEGTERFLAAQADAFAGANAEEEVGLLRSK